MSVDDNDDHPVYNGSGSTAVNATPSGDDIIDGLLGPRKWAGSFITYSDPDSGFDYQSGYFYDDDGDGISAQFDGFSQFTAAQMEVVHAALNSVIYTQPVGGGRPFGRGLHQPHHRLRGLRLGGRHHPGRQHARCVGRGQGLRLLPELVGDRGRRLLRDPDVAGRRAAATIAPSCTSSATRSG